MIVQCAGYLPYNWMNIWGKYENQLSSNLQLLVTFKSLVIVVIKNNMVKFVDDSIVYVTYDHGTRFHIPKGNFFTDG